MAPSRMQATWTSSGLGSASISASTGSRCCSSAASLTVGLGYGTTKLEFSTDQSNYLNKSDQVYKDNVAYQKLFGGEAMVTLVTMDPGHTVAELFTADGIKQWTQRRDEDRRIAPGAQRRDAAHGAPVERQSRQGPERRRHPERRREDPRRRPRARQVEGRAGRAQRVGARDDRADQRDPGRAAHARQPEVPRLPALRQSAAEATRSRSARRCCRSSPTPGTRRWSCACSATSRSRTKARPPTS